MTSAADGPAPPVLLGTVALEPNRWGTVDPSGRATTRLSRWLPAVADAGFDGLEVWERHLRDADEQEAAAVLAHRLPVAVLNSYADLDDPDPAERRAVARWAARAGSRAVKFNVGADPSAAGVYAERVAAWLDDLPPSTRLLCECHAGTAVADDPALAARVLGAAGPPARVGAIVHTHQAPDALRARFAAYGERIAHVHVNMLDPATLTAPRLRDVRTRLEDRVALLRDLGFRGSWTVEFVHGLMTTADHPEALVARAAEDLAVLRQVLG